MDNRKVRFTDEEIELANNINLMDYAISKGLELEKAGRDSYHIKGFGGLYINPISNKWNCFSHNKGGGPIQFDMFLGNRTWVEALKELLGNKSEILSGDINKKKQDQDQDKNKEIKKFILPEKNSTYKHILAYLIKTRKIDKSIVYQLIKEEKLYEDKNKNCIFVGYDINKIPRYANIRGTNTNTVFKGEVKNSDKDYSFSIEGIDNKLYVFESPIEAISYLSILKLSNSNSFNSHMISLGGVSDKALKRYLIDNTNIHDITLCLNNDKVGIEATNRIKKGYNLEYNILKEYPIRKDYNEDLNNMVNNLLILEKNITDTYMEEDEFDLEL